MSYMELFKKYRPMDWDGLVGQEGVVRDLKAEITSGQIPTAYLFAGKQHGCGKTSAAWIMAKAVNCEDVDLVSETGNPCNKCKTCLNIDDNKQLGVNYISMANNGSVKDANDILGQAQMSQAIRRPVWILDESHRMSREAAEAWLIPLESGNMKALFIFCSTEPENMIGTLKSRVQQKAFRSISDDDITKHLKEIASKEDLKLSDEKIESAAIAGDGSIRDALQNLEVISRDGKLVSSYKNKILAFLSSCDYAKAFTVSAEMDEEGQDFLKATEQLYKDFSNMLLILAGVENIDGLSRVDSYTKFATAIGANGVLQCLDILGDTLNTMIYNVVDNKILFETAMVKIIQVIRSSIKSK